MLPLVRRALVVVAAALAVAPAAHAAPVLTASAGALAYHWDLGDGTSVDGAAVQHVYAPGSYTATVTATWPDETQTQVPVRSVAVSLRAPRTGRFRARSVFTGAVAGVAPGEQVQLLVVARLGGPGPFRAVTAEAVLAFQKVRGLARTGRVDASLHVSAGATGNTPLGGFAIHGYPSVPAFPASHGCARVPLWVAPRLFSMDFGGEAVYVYQ